ncbi:glycerophosphodiester phosphodiesterase family protein [Spongiactinospora sp. TRM90649]|uniref:glycerophosphodiester phosphodiesterase n=1 Tax=Spongiactinospora sp. TRM90649 TaxID=3031114 RepID=UPI0023F98F90|nr:glycerophosphodiester phosphodiesterase family protein [Spongiactinospora sp. TRM90649]MDF5753241.1 glycerophosphodiester phosphodiesterase family protein [Spongiactinospora sp. TRM90649]
MFRPVPLVIITLLTALTAPVTLARPVAAAPSPAIVNVAHRGASADAPENTLAAFVLARVQRADVFELDVQQTSDHRLVLMHDRTLARTTDAERVFPGRAPWAVGDFTLAEIRRLDAGSWFGSRYEGERVPTLGETLAAMRGSGLGLLLEIKDPARHPGIETRVAGELRRHRAWLSAGRVIVQSFDWGSMRRFHQIMPDIPIGLLGTPEPGRLAALSRYAGLINVPYTDVTRDYVRRIHRYRMRVICWTVDGQAAMRRLAAYGVDGIVTNRPAVLRRALDR